MLVDGGLFTNINFHESILRCRDNGFKDEDIIIDMITCFDKVADVLEWETNEMTYKNAYSMF